VRDFAFYDDALLSHPERHAHLLLDQILARGLHCVFHTPNALHAGEIDEELAKKMRRAGFQSIRLGLETSDPERQRQTGGKITNERFVHAVKVLKAAGFTHQELGAYVLVGLPGQTLDEVAQSIRFVHRCGIQVRIAQYSPLPGTREWHRATEAKGAQLEKEPLLHNNTVFPLIEKAYTWKDIEGVKNLAKQLNSLLAG
jgi:radical SAM superfamily enzyme YgiQ (UPF0313 family)